MCHALLDWCPTLLKFTKSHIWNHQNKSKCFHMQIAKNHKLDVNHIPCSSSVLMNLIAQKDRTPKSHHENKTPKHTK
jgi:hypothetical protein